MKWHLLKNSEKQWPTKGGNQGGLVLDSGERGAMIIAGSGERLGARGRISAVLDEEEPGRIG
jgi:hypothetical protein